MGLILILLACATTCTIIIYNMDTSFNNRHKKYLASMFLCFTLVFFIPLPLILLASWDSYLDLHVWRATHDTNIAALTTYTDRATPFVFSTAQSSVSGKEITDVKYNEYQTSLKELVVQIRNITNRYNSKLASKRVAKNSFMFNVLIIAPDEDMKPLKF